jgi:hypothetical protein
MSRKSVSRSVGEDNDLLAHNIPSAWQESVLSILFKRQFGSKCFNSSESREKFTGPSPELWKLFWDRHLVTMENSVAESKKLRRGPARGVEAMPALVGAAFRLYFFRDHR